MNANPYLESRKAARYSGLNPYLESRRAAHNNTHWHSSHHAQKGTGFFQDFKGAFVGKHSITDKHDWETLGTAKGWRDLYNQGIAKITKPGLELSSFIPLVGEVTGPMGFALPDSIDEHGKAHWTSIAKKFQ